jgi:hypothetical protein
MNEIVLIIIAIVSVIAFVTILVNMSESSDEEIDSMFFETFTKAIPLKAIEELITIGYRVDDTVKVEIILNLISERQKLQSELVREYENILINYENFDDASIDKVNSIISGYKQSLEEADEIKKRISDNADQVLVEFKRIRAEKYLSLLQAINDFYIKKSIWQISTLSTPRRIQ